MIIRNPYGFIVKHYKLINLLLLLPMIYVVLQFSDIANFFKDYINAGYSTPESNFTGNYITGLTTFATIFLLFSNIILYAILLSKKKTSYYHLINIGYYIVLMVCLGLFTASMNSIDKNTMEMTFANFVRDTASIVTIPGYLLFIAGITKAIGFNIKTFRLDANDDLKVSEEDEEDIEIKVGSDHNSIKKNSVRFLRELKYYLLENKFVFMCIGAVLLLIVAYTTYSNYQIYNKTYTINQSFSLDNFSLSLKESYLTNVDYRGNLIEKDKYYLAIKIGLHNQGRDTIIDKSNFRIYAGKKVIYPSYDKGSRFIDIGKIYQGETIYSGESFDYVFVYELTADDVKSNYEMRILSGLTQKNTELIKQYKKINVKPKNVIKTVNLGTVKKKKEIDLSSTTIGKTKFTVNSFKIVPTYVYTYESCTSKHYCSTVNDIIVPSGGKALAIVEYDLEIDKESSYYKNSKKDFFGDFVTLNYVYKIQTGGAPGDYISTSLMRNITPINLKDKMVYEVDSNLVGATKIEMILNVRNNKVIIELK